MVDSILKTVKKVLGIEEDYTVFDPDILMHINTVFVTLQQLGVGPEEGFFVEDDEAKWVDFIGPGPTYNNVKTYVCLVVRSLFDPPSTSFHLEAMKSQITELEWRINARREEVEHPWVPEPIDPDEETLTIF